MKAVLLPDVVADKLLAFLAAKGTGRIEMDAQAGIVKDSRILKRV